MTKETNAMLSRILCVNENETEFNAIVNTQIECSNTITELDAKLADCIKYLRQVRKDLTSLKKGEYYHGNHPIDVSNL